ncbi:MULTISPECIES: hypothetical protein [Flavobacterium]|uniref:hypothetical protein n=1 Tax=Flavobacterium TaxID=237 RepID=UPI001FCB01D7|nr:MULTISPECIES: hypothetical protein [Flavobacterium]UOK42960.1 hypothetical protein LZF87_02285 [Flavobacterium enshiense]
MKLKIIIIVLIFSSIANAQKYMKIDSLEVSAEDQTGKRPNFNVFSIKSHINTITYGASSIKKTIVNKKKREGNLLETQAKVNLIKKTYNDSEHYPAKIIDGWHSIVATDSYNYCAPAKVLIKNNEIKEFVIDNWARMSMSFNVLSAIKKGKGLISVDFEGETVTLELYFTNDLEQPSVVDKPLDSGFISFWCDSKKIKEVKVFLDKKYYGELGEAFASQPQCSAAGVVTIEVKPGRHRFTAAGKGTINWEGDVEVKENLCLSYLLNSDNKKE